MELEVVDIVLTTFLPWAIYIHYFLSRQLCAYVSTINTGLLIPRIGRVFTPEAVGGLEKEFEGEGGRAAALPQSDPTLKPGTGCGGGGLLWRIAWCPLLQVKTFQGY